MSKLFTGVGLAQYARRFGDSFTDAEVLPDLTDAHLRVSASRSGAAQDCKAVAAPALTDHRRLPRPSRKQPPRRSGAAPAHGHVLRPRGLDGAVERLDPEDMCEVVGAISTVMPRPHHRCRRIRRQIYGRRSSGLFWLSASGSRTRPCGSHAPCRLGFGSSRRAPKLKTVASVPLHVRVGIATGLVVVGDLDRNGSLARAGGRRRDAGIWRRGCKPWRNRTRSS